MRDEGKEEKRWRKEIKVRRNRRNTGSMHIYNHWYRLNICVYPTAHTLWGWKNKYPPTFLNSSLWANNQINMRQTNRRKVTDSIMYIYTGVHKNMRAPGTLDR